MALKILMATMSLGIGGAETHIVELSHELKRRGFEVLIASNGGVFVPDIEKKGIRHFQVPMNRRNVFHMIRSYVLLKKIIKTEKPDIVHAHARIPAFICGLLNKRLNFPFVTTAHGVFQLGVGLTHLTNWGQKTIAVSDDIRQYLQNNYGISGRDIILSVNGIDTERFSPCTPSKAAEEFQLSGDQPVICHVSRLDESTSLVARLLIEMAPELDNVYPGIHVVIAGNGESYDELKRKAAETNRKMGREALIMTGPRTDINEILAVGTVFIGVSRAALEALAESKPVILAGNQGYIGLLAPDNLALAKESNYTCRGSILPERHLLQDEILRVLGMSADKRISLGDFGRQLVVSEYSVNRMTDDCQQVYEMIRKRRYNVVMSGYYGFGNAGDEAILQSIHQNIDSSGGDISITVLSSDPEDTKERYGYDAVNRFELFSVIKALKNCDALVSGGGSLLQDHTSTRSLFYYLMIIRASEFFGKKVMVYANGIGPVRKKINRRLVRRIVGRADVITLRDEVSAQELHSMGVCRDDIRVTSDPVFTLNGIQRDEAVSLLKGAGIPVDVPFVCVSVRNWKGMGAFKENVAGLCDRIHDQYGRNIVFIAMQTPHDIGISFEVQRLMRNKAYVLEPRYTAQQIMGIIGLSDFVFAMRLHTLIFSARMCVPFIGVVYDPKVDAYIDALGMLSAGDVREFNTELAMSSVKALMENRSDYVLSLKNTLARLESLAQQDAQLLLKLLESHNKRRT